MKKKIYFVILAFATFTLLAHTAVVHHYHEDTGICFSKHCRDSKEAHRHAQQDSQPHHHEGNHTPDECVVDNVYLPASDKITCCLHLVCDYEQIILALIDNSLTVQNVVDTKFYFRHNIVFYHHIFISQSLGLRAPPVG